MWAHIMEVFLRLFLGVQRRAGLLFYIGFSNSLAAFNGLNNNFNMG